MSFYEIISRKIRKKHVINEKCFHYSQKKYQDSSLPINAQTHNSFSSVNEFHKFCKRASFLTLSSRKKAMISLEAAVIFPLFISACLAVLFFIELFRIESCVNNALLNTGRNMGQYVALLESGEATGAALAEAGIQGASVVMAGELVKKEAGDAICNHSAIVNGKSGMSFWGSKIDSEYVDLVVHYKVKFPVPFFEMPCMSIVQRCRLHAWSGSQGNEERSKEDEFVYITPDGSVYHRNENCTHLRLSVAGVAFSEVAFKRNNGGGKYYPCERCVKNREDLTIVYITNEGTKYHALKTCGGLKRTVKTVKLSEIKDSRRACSRCGKSG